MMNHSGKKKLDHMDETKNKNYVMRILHQFKLMTSNGSCILLILVERINIDIAPTWEGLHRTTGRIEKNERIKMITKKKESEGTIVRNRK